jgi:hypothetical protein
VARIAAATKSGTTARSAAIYAAGAVAATVLLTSYVVRARASRARTDALRRPSHSLKIETREPLTAKRSLLDT